MVAAVYEEGYRLILLATTRAWDFSQDLGISGIDLIDLGNGDFA